MSRWASWFLIVLALFASVSSRQGTTLQRYPAVADTLEDEESEGPFLLVGTADGSLSYMDVGARSTLWSVRLQPLISAESDDDFEVIPGTDGSLFFVSKSSDGSTRDHFEYDGVSRGLVASDSVRQDVFQ
ncbi:MAG: hypothetical protein MHM6MM_004070, partial [Cercozoa sp. M6MM]